MVVLVPSATKVVVLVAILEVRILSLAGAGQQDRGRGVSVDCTVLALTFAAPVAAVVNNDLVPRIPCDLDVI